MAVAESKYGNGGNKMPASAKALTKVVVAPRPERRVLSWLRIWQQVAVAELLLLLNSLTAHTKPAKRR